ncbi:MAG: guanitoxin biosynthesis PLP-dependent transaminase GntE [Candidatus Promineifilaceae bacterium]
MSTLTKSQEMFIQAAQALPLGVSSNYRYWGDEDTRYIDRGKGAHIWDVDGNRYIDYRLGYGPVILGHADDRVDSAVYEAVQRGVTFAMSTPEEVELAQKITRLCPVDMVRFANSGTEAVMHALRLARAYTGREKIVIFEGQYHGLYDGVMFASNIGVDYWSGSRRSPVIYPLSSGVPDGNRDLVRMVPFNDGELLENLIEQSWHETAAVLVEPILGNCGGIMPQDGWLELIRDLCDEYGIVMIMDEVKTGFRMGKGGAQDYFGVHADLVTYAKALGNGYPIAAFGGKHQLMEQIGHGVSHGGTFCGNRVSVAAANATLDVFMETDALETVAENGRKLQEAISEVLDRYGMPYVIEGHPSLFNIWFSEEAPHEFRDWKQSDHTFYDQVAAGLIERGVMPEPDSREPWFMCEALSEEDIAFTVQMLDESVRDALG